MAPDDQHGARPAGPVVLRIKLRYDDLDAMVQKFASNVGKSGLFLPTKSIQPIGTEVKFELRLANDAPVLVGLGRVKHVRPPDPKNPKAAFGMGIELTRVSREGREVIIRMIERRRALGLPDVAIPVPEDVDAARRSEVETQPRGETSAVVRDAMASLASAPVTEQLLTAQPASGPIAIAKEPSGGIAVREASGGIAVRERPSAPLMTAPRTSSGGIPVAPLAPEKSRPRRPRVQELIDRAAELSAPMIAALPPPELDMQVDLESVLTRARSLAGGELEVELAALREAAAAPVEITIEAASAELARQLGGKPIARRDRSGSARWAPPPAVAELRARMPVIEVPAVPPRGDGDRAGVHQAIVVGDDVPQAAVAGEASQTAVADEAQRTDVTQEPALPDFAAKTRAETEGAPSATIAAAVQAAIEAAPSSSGDDDDAFVPNATTTTAVDDPLDSEAMKPRLFGTANDITTDVTGQSALMIDDDADVSSFERALDAARIHTGVSTAAAPEREDDHEVDDEYARGDKTQIGGMSVAAYAAHVPAISDQLAAQLDQQLAEAEQEAERDVADGLGGEPAYAADERDEEISELDVIAEADDDALLGAQARPEPHYGYDARGYGAAPVEQPYAAVPPVDDFASRLDLGDDEDDPAPTDDFDRDAAREFDAGVPAHDYAEPVHNDYAPQHDYIEPIRPVLPASSVDSRVPRYRRPSSEFPDPPSGGYTVAEHVPQTGITLDPDDDPAHEFDEPHSYAPAPAAAPARPVGPDPRLLRHGRATTASTEDLEDALAALDVDLDDLSNLDRRRPRRPTPGSTTGAARLPGLPIERTRGDSAQVPIVKSPTGQVPAMKSPTGQVSAMKSPTGQVPLANSPTGQVPVKSPTGQVPITRPPARTSKPPPIPAAARKAPTQQVAVVRTPSKRATTDEGVLIDFDEDE